MTGYGIGPGEMGIRAGASVYFVDSSMTRLAAWNFHDQSAVF